MAVYPPPFLFADSRGPSSLGGRSRRNRLRRNAAWRRRESAIGMTSTMLGVPIAPVPVRRSAGQEAGIPGGPSEIGQPFYGIPREIPAAPGKSVGAFQRFS